MEHDLEKSGTELNSLEADEGKSFFTRSVAFLCALGLTAALLIGYMALRWRHAERLRAEKAAQEQAIKPAPIPEIQVFLDDAMIKGSQAVLGGTIQNISKSPLTNLSVEMELKRRKDGVSEVRSLPVEPRDLAPDEQGRFSLTVTSGAFRESRVLHIKSSTRSGEIAFKTVPGAQRPPERLPETSRTIVIKPTPRREKGEEFINTPDNPTTVP